MKLGWVVWATLAVFGASSDRVLYVDPSARFSLQYPRGWHVKEDVVDGWVSFYRDHPRDGTAFVVFPRTTLAGDPDPTSATEQVLRGVAGLARYRDLRYRHRVTDFGLGVYEVRGEATWTGNGRVAMRATFVARLARPPVHGGNTAVFYLLLAQAPDREWSRWERTLTEMLRDFKWMGG